MSSAGTLTGYVRLLRQRAADVGDNGLVFDLAPTRGTGFGFGTSAQELETGTLDALRSARATLQAKAPDELEAYSSLVIEVAESVAKAVSGVSASESAAIDKIKAALVTS